MRRALLPFVVLLLTSCTVAPDTISDRLFCGLSIPGGGVVSEADIEAFLRDVVEPRFPDGFTVWRARGAWQGGREETLVLEIVHRNEPRLNRLVLEIADAYRTRFRQEAVLRVTSPATMQFIDRAVPSALRPCSAEAPCASPLAPVLAF
jgi:hypothetical protein